MRVYVDTSALLPLVHASEPEHKAVVQAVQSLSSAGASLITSSYVLVEVGALVRKRFGAAAFRRLGEAVDAVMTVIWVDEDLHRRAWECVTREGRRGPSLVDWTGFHVMRDLGISAVLATDRHFAQQGFDVLPERLS